MHSGESHKTADLSAHPHQIPVHVVQRTDEEKRKLREEALKCARWAGLTDDEWESYRTRPGLAPFQRDIGMIFDPVRKAEIVRETLTNEPLQATTQPPAQGDDTDGIDLSNLPALFTEAQSAEIGKGKEFLLGLRTTTRVLALDGNTLLDRFTDGKTVLSALKTIDEFNQQLVATQELAEAAIFRLAAVHVHLVPDLK